MKSFIIYAILLLSFSDNLKAQTDQIYKESIENYYAAKNRDKGYELKNFNIESKKQTFKYVADSLQSNALEDLLKITNAQAKGTHTCEHQKAYLNLLTRMIDSYFESKGEYNKKNKTSVTLINGNILYTIKEDYSKKTLYENFIMIFDKDNKVINHFVLE